MEALFVKILSDNNYRKRPNGECRTIRDTLLYYLGTHLESPKTFVNYLTALNQYLIPEERKIIDRLYVCDLMEYLETNIPFLRELMVYLLNEKSYLFSKNITLSPLDIFDATLTTSKLDISEMLFDDFGIGIGAPKGWIDEWLDTCVDKGRGEGNELLVFLINKGIVDRTTLTPAQRNLLVSEDINVLHRVI